MKKRSLALVAAAAAAAMTLAACGGAKETPASDVDAQSGEGYAIGITKIVSHPSLDAAQEGFERAFEEAGIPVVFDVKNAQGDQSTAADIAGAFAASDNDLILAIATPTAQAAAQAVTDKPVLFTAVTDPVDAGLVASLEAPGGNVTGTTDANPVDEQLELITEIVPDVKTIGVLYSPGEANSVVQVHWAKEAAEKLNVEIVEAPAVTSADVLQAAESLDVDAIYVPTDNIVVSALETVLSVGEKKQIPVFGAEGDSIARGAIATYGLNYSDLGYQTGKMAISILVDGADPATMPVETLDNPTLYVNKAAAERMGVTLPDNIVEQALPENITE